MTLVLTLPMPENVANARMHWRTKHRARKSYFGVCDGRQGMGQIAPPPLQAFAHATIQATMYLGASMDHDNALARLKWAVDWLVTRGYLLDDNRACLAWDGLPHQIIKRDGNYRVVLTLSPTQESQP